MTRVLSAVPIVPARDLEATTAWYRDYLGFVTRHIEDEYGIVERDGVEVHFWGPSGIEPLKSVTMYRLGIDGIDALYERCEQAGIVHPNGPLEAKHWGTREFAVGDCDGNLVRFFEPDS
jgi:catechol 2,3-dioxygenase-like lactoylglutathione lyase family enzyme